MIPIPQILLAEFITWKHLATKPLGFILSDESMSVSDQSELIQSQFALTIKKVQELGFDPISEAFKSTCASFEEQHGLENILFSILSDFEKDFPEMPDFGKGLNA